MVIITDRSSCRHQTVSENGQKRSVHFYGQWRIQKWRKKGQRVRPLALKVKSEGKKGSEREERKKAER